ncbi:MAG: RidA family protein [Candidatus Limnocylindrales bacterium]
MPKKVLMPATRLPFSQLIEANGFVFVAGQVGDDPATGALAPGGIRGEVRQMLENVGARLRVAGLDFADVVKATVYLTDMDDFAGYNEVYREFFPVDPPVRATVGVTRLAIGASCEIEVIAAR